MAIERKTNKFDSAIEELNAQEEISTKSTQKVIQNLAGDTKKTRILTDKNGRQRKVRIREERKIMSLYIPLSLYDKFLAINEAYNKSSNAAIVELITKYVAENKDILE